MHKHKLSRSSDRFARQDSRSRYIEEQYESSRKVSVKSQILFLKRNGFNYQLKACYEEFFDQDIMMETTRIESTGKSKRRKYQAIQNWYRIMFGYLDQILLWGKNWDTRKFGTERTTKREISDGGSIPGAFHFAFTCITNSICSFYLIIF